MRLFKVLIFCLILGILNIYPPNIFFQYCSNLGGCGSKILRYIRIFNVQYIRTILRSNKEEAEVPKQVLPFVPARYFRTSEAFSEHERHFFVVLRVFREFFKNVLSIILKLCAV